MNNETLSPKQARNIMDAMQDIISTLIRSIDSKNEEFVQKVKDIWEDQHALDYMTEHTTKMNTLQGDIVKQTRKFMDTVAEIGTKYINVGGMNITINPNNIPSAAEISIAGKILTHFVNGENEDEFGFKNVDLGSEQVMSAFDELKKSLLNEAANTQSRIKGINAFGNTAVRNNLAESAGRIITFIEDTIGELSTSIRQRVDEAVQEYKATGTESSGTASAAIGTVPGIGAAISGNQQ